MKSVLLAIIYPDDSSCNSRFPHSPERLKSFLATRKGFSLKLGPEAGIMAAVPIHMNP
jgi:hypothetical protein